MVCTGRLVFRCQLTCSAPRYHGKCLKIARGKVKDEDKYTCPICDWRVKIPRDAARPKLEELQAWADDIAALPFQPEEEEVLEKIIDNAQRFRDHIAGYVNPILSTEAEADTQRFYLRKIEGAEILLSYETNFFRQELHRWCPVAPEAPPVTAESKSTRKPRPTKLQKLLMQYNVEDVEDLPDDAKAKANSLKRKAMQAAAQAQAQAQASAPGVRSSDGMTPTTPTQFSGNIHPPFFSHSSQPPSAGLTSSTHQRSPQRSERSLKVEAMDIDGGPALHAGLFIGNGSGGPQLIGDGPAISVEERFLQGDESLYTGEGKAQALEYVKRAEGERKRAEEVFGPDVWTDELSSTSRSGPIRLAAQEDDGDMVNMFVDLTDPDEEEDSPSKKKDEPATTAAAPDAAITADSLESERNGMDALLDGA
jgi:[histone H3]-trimethyl-L-lysine4 demethylase